MWVPPPHRHQLRGGERRQKSGLRAGPQYAHSSGPGDNGRDEPGSGFGHRKCPGLPLGPEGGPHCHSPQRGVPRILEDRGHHHPGPDPHSSIMKAWVRGAGVGNPTVSGQKNSRIHPPDWPFVLGLGLLLTAGVPGAVIAWQSPDHCGCPHASPTTHERKEGLGETSCPLQLFLPPVTHGGTPSPASVTAQETNPESCNKESQKGVWAAPHFCQCSAHQHIRPPPTRDTFCCPIPSCIQPQRLLWG